MNCDFNRLRSFQNLTFRKSFPWFEKFWKSFKILLHTCYWHLITLTFLKTASLSFLDLWSPLLYIFMFNLSYMAKFLILKIFTLDNCVYIQKYNKPTSRCPINRSILDFFSFQFFLFYRKLILKFAVICTPRLSIGVPIFNSLFPFLSIF